LEAQGDLERLNARIAKAEANLSRYAGAKRPERAWYKWIAAKGEVALASYQKRLLLEKETEAMERPGRYIAMRGFTAGGMAYPRGAELAPAAIARWRNGPSLLNNGTIVWSLTASAPVVKPRAVAAPKPEPVRKAPTIKIIPDADIVESWNRTQAAVVDQLDGNVARARDYLFGQDDTARLYQR